MKTVHSFRVPQQVCGRSGCTTVPVRGEKFCSVIHERQHGLLYGWDAAAVEESEGGDV